MELLMAVVIGVLFAAGTYLILTRSLLRVVLGTGLLSHASFLLILTMGGLKRGAPPILSGQAAYTDPLPHALILTAIVIGFGVTAFVLVLAYRAYQELGTDDLDKLRGVKDE
jgi:multicomponent Na+:H+ antiporter subunit C